MSLTVPTYIRTQDQDKYLEIVAKGRGEWTEFVHIALNSPYGLAKSAVPSKKPLTDKDIDDFVEKFDSTDKFAAKDKPFEGPIPRSKKKI